MTTTKKTVANSNQKELQQKENSTNFFENMDKYQNLFKGLKNNVNASVYNYENLRTFILQLKPNYSNLDKKEFSKKARNIARNYLISFFEAYAKASTQNQKDAISKDFYKMYSKIYLVVDFKPTSLFSSKLDENKQKLISTFLPQIQNNLKKLSII